MRPRRCRPWASSPRAPAPPRSSCLSRRYTSVGSIRHVSPRRAIQAAGQLAAVPRVLHQQTQQRAAQLTPSCPLQSTVAPCSPASRHLRLLPAVLSLTNHYSSLTANARAYRTGCCQPPKVDNSRPNGDCTRSWRYSGWQCRQTSWRGGKGRGQQMTQLTMPTLRGVARGIAATGALLALAVAGALPRAPPRHAHASRARSSREPRAR